MRTIDKVCWALAAVVEGWGLGFCGFVLGAAGGWLEGQATGGLCTALGFFLSFFVAFFHVYYILGW